MAQINKPRKSRAQREAEIEEEFDRKHNPQKFKKEEPEAPDKKKEDNMPYGAEQREMPTGKHGIPAAPKEKSKTKEAVAEVLPAALNPIELAQRVRDLVMPQNRQKLKEGVKTTLGSLATAGNEALYNIPSKIKPVGKYLKKFQEENPTAAKAGEILGIGGSFVVPGGAIKAASKINKVGKFFNKGGVISRNAKSGAVYGGLAGLGEMLSPQHVGPKDTSDIVSRAAVNAIQGAALGGATGWAFKGLGSLLKSKPAKAREFIVQARRDLLGKLGSRDVKIAENLAKAPSDNKYVNLNTLIHKGTAKTDSIADALYQMEPGARQILQGAKKNLADKQHFIVKDVLNDLAGGKRQTVEEFVEKTKKVGRRAARPLYEKFYQSGDVALPGEITGDQKFKAFGKKAMANYNDLHKGLADYSANSPRTLNQIKKSLQSKAESFGRAGDAEEARLHSITADPLKKLLLAHSPDYGKALKTAEGYLKVEGAAKAGSKFKDMTAQDIDKIIGSGNKRVAKGFQLGVLENLADNANQKATGSEFSNIGKELSNREIQSRLISAFGKSKAGKAATTANDLNKAFNAFSKFTGGSQTSEHLSNQRLATTAVKAMAGSYRAIAYLLNKVSNVAKGGLNKKQAKIHMRAFLNPEVLQAAKLKFARQKINPISSKIIPTIWSRYYANQKRQNYTR
jgi:hypothetical protein